MLTQIEV